MTVPSSLPAPPTGVPAWLIRLVAAVLAVAGPLLAFVDPDATKFTPAVKATIILVFLVAAIIIFLVHLVLAAVHEYGWSMNAVTHVDTAAEAELKSLWPEIKQSYTDALPALEQVKGVSGAIDAITSDVTDLKSRAVQSGLDPSSVVAAFEQATGMTFPRAAPEPAAAAAAAVAAVADPGVTGQAS